MDGQKLFRLASALFWGLVLALVAVDTLHSSGVRVEPPPIALGSGQMASGGHCSGR